MKEEKKAERPKQVMVECVVSNVWTKRGKMLAGQQKEISESEALELAGKVKVLEEKK